MGAPSRKNIRAEVFAALGNNSNCEYSYEQLEALFSQTYVSDKTTSKRRTSAFDMWKKLSKEEKEELKWSEFKIKYPDQVDEFQSQADEYNNLHFDNKSQKSSSNKNNNDELKKEIARLKKTHKTEGSSKDPVEDDKPEAPVEDDKPEAPTEDDEPEAPTEDDDFDKIDVNKDGVITRDEFESYSKQVEEDNENDQVEEDDENDQVEEDDENSNKPVFKKKITIMNQYKEWKKNELGIDVEKSISTSDFKDYKIEDQFDPDDYDESKLWFEYIQNNMNFQ